MPNATPRGLYVDVPAGGRIGHLPVLAPVLGERFDKEVLALVLAHLRKGWARGEHGRNEGGDEGAHGGDPTGRPYHIGAAGDKGAGGNTLLHSHVT